jgi:protein ImuB
MIVNAVNAGAEAQGVYKGMVLADARVIIPGLQVLDDKPALAEKLLKRIGEWCIRFTPFTAIDLPDGIILDVTGCSHLWSGDKPYLNEIVNRLNAGLSK